MEKFDINNLTDKEKVNLVNALCRHLKKGFSEYSFVKCDYKLIEKYASELDEKNQNSILADKLNRASRFSFYYWEKIGIEIFNNEKDKKYFPMWMFFVKNRFLWGAKRNKQNENKNKITNAEYILIPEKTTKENK